MNYQILSDKDSSAHNKLVNHIMQSWQWGDFRQKLGTKVLRVGLLEKEQIVSALQMTLHQIPLTEQFIGYIPKGPLPDLKLAQILTKIGSENNCAAIKIEPHLETGEVDQHFIKSSHPLFTEYNYLLDLTQSEEKILQNMHPKFRYNIKVAQKHQVFVREETDEQGFKTHLQLHFATTKRQGFYSHNEKYHQLLWETLKETDSLKILIAYYQPDKSTPAIPLASWMLFIFKNTLYYPYGGSSTEYKNLMASNLIAWEAIKLGKKLNLTTFDLWGALGPEVKEDHPWQGFNRFKRQTGAKLVKYLGTYDLVLNPFIYWPFTIIDSLTPLKVCLLKLIRKS